ncbi:OmpL47-type beta-barrel domain-containing protein [Microbacterium sp. CFBP9034]|uniref:OmpL47-type beta-barrel domain-containing protein n=1 Tax=Microbacterium sp. CFBP9034 TaxID=3096540 RepID=UPI002A6A7FDB|nr:Ig-like domain-containing protein [Microbacterium sp. CFBP9034]MDY0908609.1 Ig-like domain-containing protein [Microbacterium sp. CFBP9034]
MHTLRSGRTGVRRRIALAMAVSLALVGAGAMAMPATAADEPINVALAAGENAPTVEVSYVPGWNSSAALNNGASAPTNTLSAMWGTWGAPGSPTQDIATYTWERPVTVSSSKLFLWQNHLTPGGDSGVMIPAAWKIEYRSSTGEWTPVTGPSLSYPLPVLSTTAPVTSQPVVTANFTAVTTTGVRLVLDRVLFSGQRKATSVIEWEVWGVNAPIEEPEPEDPNAFLESEPVAVRTVTGTAPQLPEQVWVIGEDGPLTYVDVEWAPMAAAGYAAAGSFEVLGDPEGYDGQSVAATVYVAGTLSDVIESVEYAATITTPGVAPVLPRSVVGTYDDGTASSSVPVEWAAIDPSAYAEADAIFDVAGTVAGYASGATATVFVVEPLSQAEPIVSIEFSAAPQGSGWYTTAPTVTVTAEETASPIAAIEYSLDGETWTPYTEPFAVSAQGDVTVSARATSEDDAVGEASESIKVDTIAPTTGIDWIVVDGSSATVTLTPSDEEPGSGVTRTVWSDGPDSSPTGETNNMYATYEEPFSVQLTEAPRYVHVQAQDAAGNVEEHLTVELPTLVGETLDLQPVVSQRCVAGKVVLVVSVRNADDVAAEVQVTTAYGSKTFASVKAGGTSSASFTARTVGVATGQVTVAGSSADGLEYAGSVSYPAFSCG